MRDRNQLTRRDMLHKTSLGLVGMGGGLAQGVSARKEGADREPGPQRRNSRQSVVVATFCQEKLKADSPESMIQKVLHAMEEVVPLKPDILCLPEVFHVANLTKRPASRDAAEQPIGRYSRAFAEFARMHRMNIVCPIYTREAGKTYNAAVVIDRRGALVGDYRKINPTEGELAAGITPGPLELPVFRLDCATIGIQICFDINWPDNWAKLAQKGAEVVFWPSAFAGGQMLNAHALTYRTYVVSSTRIRGAAIVNPLGDTVETTGRFGTWLCRPLNLDCAVIQGWQDIAKIDELRRKYGHQASVTVKHVEALALLESHSDRWTSRAMMETFGIETSRAMLRRNTELQDRHRHVS